MKLNKKKWLKAFGWVTIFLGILGVIIFATRAQIDRDPRVWFTPIYYSQFFPVAVSVMLFVCGIFLVFDQKRANFNLAVFGHTASEEALFDWLGLTQSSLPLWTKWLVFFLSIITLWIAYSNVLGQKKLSLLEAGFGVSFGAFVVLFPVIFN